MTFNFFMMMMLMTDCMFLNDDDFNFDPDFKVFFFRLLNNSWFICLVKIVELAKSERSKVLAKRSPAEKTNSNSNFSVA
jgi:hypothetical protein